MTELRLTRPEILKLIEMYKQNECLWNIHTPMYKKYELKQMAWDKIAKEFNTNVDNVKKKIKFLRTTFSSEKKKVDHSMKTGRALDIYVPSLFYYNDISFLKNTILARDSNSTENSSNENNVEIFNKTTQDTGVNQVEINSDVPTAPIIKKPKRNFIEKHERDYEASETPPMKAPPTNADEMFLAFGNSIGMQLKQLPIVEAARIMSNIQKLLSDSLVSYFISSSGESPSQLFYSNEKLQNNSQLPSEKVLYENGNNWDVNLDIVKTEEL